tara:strand:- start:693 stop:1505 length:813 start_codon:yes stop_codon:yes gene_type:complete
MRQNDERIGTPQPSPVPQTSVGGLNYVIPTEIVELPSKGVLYPPEHPLYGKEYVEIKQMTAKEEDILTSATLIEKGLVLDHLIQSLLLDKNVSAKTLFSGDKNAILLNARINAYGNEYKASSLCNECGSSSEVTFDLLGVKNKEIDYEDVHLHLDLPKTKFKAAIKFLNSHQEDLLIKEIEKKKNLGIGDNTVTTFLKFVIISINGLSSAESDVNHFIDNMPSSDASYIKNQYAKMKPDVDFSFEVECFSCLNVERREVPITAQFFWPNP